MHAQQIPAVVIGFGSIGSRHARVLKELGHAVAVVSRRDLKEYPVYGDCAAALKATGAEYVVIANETSRHAETLAELDRLNFSGKVLVEKPIAAVPIAYDSKWTGRVFTAYQLRFHPILSRLKERLAGERLINMQIYVGQDLPSWRRDRNFKESYSARRDLGGGALRDLSHDLDYALWLGGNWRRLTALGGRFGGFTVDSDDTWGILMETEHCPVVTVNLNYLDRMRRREIIVNTAQRTYHADLMNWTLAGEDQIERIPIDPDLPFRLEHLAVLGGDQFKLCSAAQGLKVVDLVCRIEAAADGGKWVAL